jgi:hypothetical protein
LGVEGSRADQERQAHLKEVAKRLTKRVMDFWNQMDELIRIKHLESIRSKEKVRLTS